MMKTIYFEDFPISDAKFMNTSHTFVVSSFQKKHLIAYNIQSNKETRISSSLFTRNVGVRGKRNVLVNFCIDPQDTYLAVYSESGYIGILDG